MRFFSSFSQLTNELYNDASIRRAHPECSPHSTPDDGYYVTTHPHMCVLYVYVVCVHALRPGTAVCDIHKFTHHFYSAGVNGSCVSAACLHTFNPYLNNSRARTEKRAKSPRVQGLGGSDIVADMHFPAVCARAHSIFTPFFRGAKTQPFSSVPRPWPNKVTYTHMKRTRTTTTP